MCVFTGFEEVPCCAEGEQGHTFVPATLPEVPASSCVYHHVGPNANCSVVGLIGVTVSWMVLSSRLLCLVICVCVRHVTHARPMLHVNSLRTLWCAARHTALPHAPAPPAPAHGARPLLREHPPCDGWHMRLLPYPEHRPGVSPSALPSLPTPFSHMPARQLLLTRARISPHVRAGKRSAPGQPAQAH